MPELRMPSLGADMDHGKVVEWLVKPGDLVHRGDLVAVVDTDKTVMDVESFEDGVVTEFLVDLGVTVPVGTAIAQLAEQPAPRARTTAPAAPERPEPREPVPTHAEAARPAALPEPAAPRGPAALPVPAAPGGPAAPPGPPAAAPAGPATPGRVRSSPLARRLAAQLGLDLAAITGTGQQGSVTEADVRRAVAAEATEKEAEKEAGQPAEAPPAPSPPAAVVRPAARPEEPEELRAPRRHAAQESDKSATLRASLAALMAKSKATIPHYYLSSTLDLGPVMARMQEMNADRPVAARLVPASFLLKAAAVAAREVPGVNGFFADGAFAASEHVHLGVAVALRGGGLVAPALHDADRLSVDELMAALRDLVARARSGRLKRTEMADPTITVTSMGDLGVEAVFGVIVPPQVAMVGFGRVMERPWAHGGMLGVRPTVTATLSGDHRVSDGLGGARYLVRLEELLNSPEEL